MSKFKTREQIANETRGMSEPQLVDYIDDICLRLDRITHQLEVTEKNLSLAMDGGAENQKALEDLKKEHKELQKKYDDLEQEKNRLEQEKNDLKMQLSDQKGDLQVLRGKHYGTGPEKGPDPKLQDSMLQKGSTGETQQGTPNGKAAGESGTKGQHEKDGGVDSNCTGDKLGSQGNAGENKNETEGNGHDKQPPKEGEQDKKASKKGRQDKKASKKGGQDKKKSKENEDEKPPKKSSNKKPPKRNLAAANDDYDNIPRFDTYADLEKHKKLLEAQYPGCRIKLSNKYHTCMHLIGIPAVCAMEVKHWPFFTVFPPGREPFQAVAEGDKYVDEVLNSRIPASARFVATAIYNRVCMLMPLNRQLTSFKDFGLDMNLSKLSDWNMDFTEEYLNPISDYLWKILFSEYKILQFDETRWLCIAWGKRGYAFLVRTSELGEHDKDGNILPSICCVNIRDGRKCDFLVPWLKGKPHVAVVDGYSGYGALQNNPELEFSKAGCWSHKRRPYIELYDILPAEIKNDPEALKECVAWFFLAIIGNVYHYDTPAKKWDRYHRGVARMVLVKPFVDFCFESEEMLRQQLGITAADVDEEDETADEEEKKQRILTKIEKINAQLHETGALADDFDDECDDLDALIREKKIEVEQKLEFLKERRDAIFPKLNSTNVSKQLMKALGYRMNNKSDFYMFLTDPDIPIENNASERMARNVAFGRANYFFTRNERANKVLQSQFSLCLTARANDADPFVYLVYCLTTMAKYKRDHCMERKDSNFSDEFLKTLTPWSKEYKEFAERERDRIYYGWFSENREPTFPLKQENKPRRGTTSTDTIHNTEGINKTPSTENTNKTPDTEDTNKTPDTEDTNKTPDTEDTNKTPDTEDTNKTPDTDDTNQTTNTEDTNTDDADAISNTDDTDLTHNTDDTDQAHNTEDTNLARSTENTGSSHSTMTLDELLNIMKEAPNTIQRSKPAACIYTGEPVLKVPSKAQQKKARGP